MGGAGHSARGPVDLAGGPVHSAGGPVHLVGGTGHPADFPRPLAWRSSDSAESALPLVGGRAQPAGGRGDSAGGRQDSAEPEPQTAGFSPARHRPLVRSPPWNPHLGASPEEYHYQGPFRPPLRIHWNDGDGHGGRPGRQPYAAHRGVGTSAVVAVTKPRQMSRSADGLWPLLGARSHPRQRQDLTRDLGQLGFTPMTSPRREGYRVRWPHLELRQPRDLLPVN